MKYWNRKLVCLVVLAGISGSYCLPASVAQAQTNEQQLVEVHNQMTALEEKIAKLEASINQTDNSVVEFKQQIKALEMKIEEQKVAIQKLASQNDKLEPLLNKKVATWRESEDLLQQDSEESNVSFEPVTELPEEKQIYLIEQQINEVQGQKKLLVVELAQQNFALKKANIAKELAVKEAAASQPNSGVAPEQLAAV